MAKIVMKFGGTSVADLDRIRHVAGLVKAEGERATQVAVVVSAMAGETNKLVAWARELSPLHDPREYDVVVAAGEQITAGLLAIALSSLGVQARSWMGWQIPVRDIGRPRRSENRTDRSRTAERNDCRWPDGGHCGLPGHRAGRPHRDHRARRVGYQRRRRRGGCQSRSVRHLHRRRRRLHDRSANCAPGAAARADRLSRRCSKWPLMGAKVLQTRSVEIAMLHRVPVRVLSTFEPDGAGTLLCDEEDIVEKKPVTGIAYSRDEAKITLHRIPDKPGIAAAIFGPLARCRRQRRHDRAERVGGRQKNRSHFHRQPQRPPSRA